MRKDIFIDETDKKIECWIKNVDWKDNPSRFEYKLSEPGDIREATIQEVKEFSIAGVSKYIRANVKIDRSSDEIDKMTSDRNPTFKNDVLFLLLLVEGKASLFAYQEGNMKRFFYKTNDTDVEQLIFKRYLTDENKIAKNNAFMQQLLGLKCQTISSNDVQQVGYNESSLSRFFVTYNKCSDPTYVSTEKKEKRDLFSLTIRPGLNVSSLSMEEGSSAFPRNTDFGATLTPRFGIEAEFILPFNKNKWSLAIEPTYQYFKAETSIQASFVQGGELIANVDYHSVELPVVFRYYIFLKSEARLFFNTGFIIDFPTKTNLEFYRNDGTLFESLEMSTRYNLALGAGYHFKNKLSIEARYQTSQDLLNKNVSWTTRYLTSSLIIGYTF